MITNNTNVKASCIMFDSDAKSSIVHFISLDFEERWRNTINGFPPPDIKDFYDPTIKDHDLNLLINLCCIDLEKRIVLKNFKILNLEDYLFEYPILKDNQQAILELVRIEISAKTLMGYKISINDYIEKFSLPSSLLLDRANPKSDATIQIKDFEIIRQIGKGGMGTVYLARDLSFSKPLEVALKVLNENFLNHNLNILRFGREASVPADLAHKNIVQIFKFINDKQAPYYTMEYCSKGSLKNLTQNNPINFKEAVDIIVQVSRGVGFLHENGYIHRDIKPENILITNSGIPKIADFGLTKKIDGTEQITETGAVLGTWHYLSPEHIEKNKELEFESDVYSLGATLYKLIVGHPPFTTPNIKDFIEQLLTKNPPPIRSINRNIPKDLNNIVLKALSKNPKKRYKNANYFADDLEKFQKGLPVKARPLNLIEKSIRWIRLNKFTAFFICTMFAYAISMGNSNQKLNLSNLMLDESINKLKRSEEVNKATISSLNSSVATLNSLNTSDKIKKAYFEIALGNFGNTLKHLKSIPFSQRSFEHDLLFSMVKRYEIDCVKHDCEINCFAISEDPLTGAILLAWFDSKNNFNVYDIIKSNIVFTKNINKVVSKIVSDSKLCRFLAISEDNKLLIWDSRKKALIEINISIKSLNDVVFSQKNDDILFASSEDGILWSVNLENFKFIKLSKEHFSNFKIFQIYDKEIFHLVTCGLNNEKKTEIIFWKNLPNFKFEVVRKLIIHDILDFLVLNPNGLSIAGLTKKSELIVYDLKTLKNLNKNLNLYNFKNLTYSPDGQFLVASFDNQILVFDTLYYKILKTYIGHSLPITNIHFDKSSKIIFTSGYDKVIKAWDIDPKPEMVKINFQEMDLRSLAINDNGTMFAVGGINSDIKVWDIKNNKLFQIIKNAHDGSVNKILFSKDNTCMVSASSDKKIKKWKLINGRFVEIQKFEGHTDPVNSICLDNSNKILFSCSSDHSVREWDFHDARLIYVHEGLHAHTVNDIKTFDGFGRFFSAGQNSGVLNPAFPYYFFRSDLTEITSIDIDKSNSRVIASLVDGKINTWNLSNLKKTYFIYSFLCFLNNSITTFLPQFKMLGNLTVYEEAVFIKKIFNFLNLKHIDSNWKIIDGHYGKINMVVFSQDSQRFISCGDDSYIRIWNSHNNSEILSFKAFDEPVKCFAISGDGKTLIAGSPNGLIKIWDLSLELDIYEDFGLRENFEFLKIDDPRNGDLERIPTFGDDDSGNPDLFQRIDKKSKIEFLKHSKNLIGKLRLNNQNFHVESFRNAVIRKDFFMALYHQSKIDDPFLKKAYSFEISNKFN